MKIQTGQEIILRKEYLEYNNRRYIKIENKVTVREISEGDCFPFLIKDNNNDIHYIGYEDIDMKATKRYKLRTSILNLLKSIRLYLDC